MQETKDHSLQQYKFPTVRFYNISKYFYKCHIAECLCYAALGEHRVCTWSSNTGRGACSIWVCVLLFAASAKSGRSRVFFLIPSPQFTVTNPQNLHRRANAVQGQGAMFLSISVLTQEKKTIRRLPSSSERLGEKRVTGGDCLQAWKNNNLCFFFMDKYCD